MGRVLELVDHDRAQPPALALTDLLVVAQQIPRVQLEILEVERGVAVLGRPVGLGEGLQQLLQEIAVAPCELVERSSLDPRAGLLVGREALARTTLGGVAGEVEQFFGDRRGSEQLEHARDRLVRALVQQALRGVAQLLEPLGKLRPPRQLELERTPGGTKRLEGAGDHPPQAARAVGREQSQPLAVLISAEHRQRLVEGLALDDPRLAVVQHAVARIDPGRERMGLEQPVAETVDGRDPGSVERAGEVVPAELEQSRANARGELAGRALRVRDDENRLDVEPPVADGAHVALDQHCRLSRPGAGRDEDDAGRLDRRELLGVGRRPQARLTRHIDHRSHQDGQGKPPFGSCSTSPSRIRSTSAVARSFPVSTWRQNSSSSR